MYYRVLERESRHYSWGMLHDHPRAASVYFPSRNLFKLFYFLLSQRNLKQCQEAKRIRPITCYSASVAENFREEME